MHLPSFIWLWRIAAWAMGGTMLLYVIQIALGLSVRRQRIERDASKRVWYRHWHFWTGIAMLALILLLLAIGIVGTLGHFGSLGHSWHLPAGLTVVGLAIASAVTGSRINSKHPLSRTIHLSINGALAVSLLLVLVSGWSVVQKYLP